MDIELLRASDSVLQGLKIPRKSEVEDALYLLAVEFRIRGVVFHIEIVKTFRMPESPGLKQCGCPPKRR